ncbi:hypothetical protein, partial [Massilia terrae]
LFVKEQADCTALLRFANRCVRQQQRSEIMLDFAELVNFFFLRPPLLLLVELRRCEGPEL